MRDPLLGPDEVRSLADDLPLWSVDAVVLRRTVTASSFQAAIEHVVAIARVAEELDHHPDIDIRWRTLHLALTTHDSGGLTRRDVTLARRIDTIVADGQP